MNNKLFIKEKKISQEMLENVLITKDCINEEDETKLEYLKKVEEERIKA